MKVELINVKVLICSWGGGAFVSKCGGCNTLALHTALKAQWEYNATTNFAALELSSVLS